MYSYLLFLLLSLSACVHMNDLIAGRVPSRGKFRLGALSICQNYPARSVKALTVCTKEMVFQQNLLEKSTFFIVKTTGPVMVRPPSSDFWKAPLVSG